MLLTFNFFYVILISVKRTERNFIMSIYTPKKEDIVVKTNHTTANDDQQFVVEFINTKKFGTPLEIAACGFQFRDDAEHWASESLKHKQDDKLKYFITLRTNEQVDRIMNPTQEDIDEYDAMYSAYAD